MPLNDENGLPLVAVDFMNRDHSEAAALLYALLDAIVALEAGENTQALINERLDQMFVHTKEHFAREEGEMLRVSFPPYSCHKGEHDRVLAELVDIHQQWSNTQDAAALQHYLKQTFTPWLINHISTMDTVTAHFISRQP